MAGMLDPMSKDTGQEEKGQTNLLLAAQLSQN